MGRTYGVPRSVKGESRFLYIFSIKSTITTIIGAVIGLVFYFIFSLANLKTAGFIILIIFAIIGYCIGTFSIPDTPVVGNLRKAGGEPISTILIRTATFLKRKKIYVYREVGKKDGQ